jgi:hypothetical protein
MQRCAVGLLEIAPTARAMQLAPRSTAGMTVRRNIAQPEPATIATVTIGTEMIGGVDMTAAASCRRSRRGWRRRGLQPGSLDRLLTSSARGFTGETRKGFGRRGAFAWWRHGRGWYRSSGGGLRWPQPREHEKHPHQSDQHELVETRLAIMAQSPHTGGERGIVPDWRAIGITRRIQVQDQRAWLRVEC